jgi:hypothetical protein
MNWAGWGMIIIPIITFIGLSKQINMIGSILQNWICMLQLKRQNEL